ncbi:unnamed protein product, partial [Choristocarpus tenellus]
ILSRNGGIQLATLDQKPDRPDERRRIQSAGGVVFYSRVMGELAVSRAFGDAHFKALEGGGNVSGGFDVGER